MCVFQKCSRRPIIRTSRSHKIGMIYRTAPITDQRSNSFPKKQFLTVLEVALKNSRFQGPSQFRHENVCYDVYLLVLRCRYTHCRAYWWPRKSARFLCTPKYLQRCHCPIIALASLGLPHGSHQSFCHKVSHTSPHCSKCQL